MHYAKLTTAICALTLAGMSHAQTNEESSDTSASSMTNVSCGSSLAISDTNNDGTVSQEEFKTWNDSGFQKLDENGDGQLSRAEYVDCISDMPGEQSATASGSSQDMMEADADADGAVSSREYMSATNDAQQQAEAGDSNGVVLLRRFILVPSNLPDEDIGSMSRSEVASSSSQRFRSMDANMDGKISSDEVNADGGEASQSWANADFDKMDGNSDGNVTMSEYSDYTEERWNIASDYATDEQQETSGEESGQMPNVYYFYFHDTAPNL